jgi:hypothetical protein
MTAISDELAGCHALAHTLEPCTSVVHDVLDRQRRVTTFDAMKDEPLEAFSGARPH